MQCCCRRCCRCRYLIIYWQALFNGLAAAGAAYAPIHSHTSSHTHSHTLTHTHTEGDDTHGLKCCRQKLLRLTPRLALRLAAQAESEIELRHCLRLRSGQAREARGEWEARRTSACWYLLPVGSLKAPHSAAINFLLDYIKFTNDLSMLTAASVASLPLLTPIPPWRALSSQEHVVHPIGTIEQGQQQPQDVRAAFNATM